MAIDWGVNQLRVSVFCTGATTASDADWKVLTGQDEADSRVAIPGGKRLSGKSAGGTLSLAYAGPRLDLILQHLDSNPEKVELPIIGQWTKVRDDFSQMGVQLLGLVKVPIVRLAFGAVLFAERDSTEASYEELRQLLKSVAVEPRKMRDLLYRVNWRADSKVAPIKINRLTTWASMRFAAKLIQLTGDQMNVAGDAANEQFAVRAEFDHNTDAGNVEPFDGEKAKAILKELVSLATENAEKGEVIS